MTDQRRNEILFIASQKSEAHLVIFGEPQSPAHGWQESRLHRTSRIGYPPRDVDHARAHAWGS